MEETLLEQHNLSVSSPLDVYTISATSSQDIGINLSIFLANDVDAIEKNIKGAKGINAIVEDRAFGLADRTAQLVNVSLPIGEYKIVIAKDASVETILEVLHAPVLPKQTTMLNANNLGSLKTPQHISSSDIVADRTNARYYLSMQSLSTNIKPQTATLTFAGGGNASLNLYDANGKNIGSSSGPSPLTLSSIKGKKFVIGIDNKLPRGLEQGQWRLRLTDSTNPDWVIEGYENIDSIDASSTKVLSSTNTKLVAYLDPQDTDVYRIQPESAQGMYTVRYLGPSAHLVADVDGNTEVATGPESSLGPFSTQASVKLTIQKGQAGSYQILREPLASKGPKELEPNNNQSQQVFSASDRVQGKLSSNIDVDNLEFDLGEVGQMWRILVFGESVNKVVVSDTFEELLIHKRAHNDRDRRLSIPDAYFESGSIKLRISGKAGQYRIILKALGTPLETSEREPNHKTPRRIAIGKPYIGSLLSNDTDYFSFYLLHDAVLNLSTIVPPGALFNGHFYSNDDYQVAPLNKFQLSQTTKPMVVKLPAGEHLFGLSPHIASPAEYEFQFDYISPFSSGAIKMTGVDDVPILQAFSQSGQKIYIKLPSEQAQEAGVNQGQLPDIQLWSPELIASVNTEEMRWLEEHLLIPINVQADIPVGEYPMSIAFGSPEQIDAISDFTIESALHGKAVAPIDDLPADKNMLGGINVALAALGATWISIPDFELDLGTGDLSKTNSAGAASLLRLNDGIQAIGDKSYSTTLFSKGQRVYYPTLDLPGDTPIPLVGVGLSNKIKGSNQFSNFSIDISNDSQQWKQVLTAQLNVWGERQYFKFDQSNLRAKYVRLRAMKTPDNNEQPIRLSEFEVIAAPGRSGLTGIDISAKNLGALGREFGNWAYARDFYFGIMNVENGSVKEAAGGYRIDEKWTETNIVKTFKNQSSADVEALVFYYGGANKNASYKSPKYAKVMSSQTGPDGPFKEVEVLTLPEDFAPGSVYKIELAQRESMNAIRIEYALTNSESENTSERNIIVPAYYGVIERPESEEYQSILGLNREFSVNNSSKNDTINTKKSDFIKKNQVLKLNSNMQVGRVQFAKKVNQWKILANEKYNTATIAVRGEIGFSPGLKASLASSEEVVNPISIEASKRNNQINYQFDLSDGDLLIELSEPARSTVFLVDQSPSVAPFIKPIRRAIVDFSNDMVRSRDAILLKALGREWSSEDWLKDPEIVRRNLLQYLLDGNSAAEGAITQGAERLIDRQGARAIVIIADADTGPDPNIFRALSASAARVFVMKVSSAQMWGDPLQSIAVAQQWAAMSGGELVYVKRPQDISTAYARVGARLLGEKAYEISAIGSVRIIQPGTFSMSRIDELSIDAGTFYHVLLDASGSMLKRTENSRRIQIAKKALSEFASTKLKATDNIGIRTFGGAADTCETELVLEPHNGTVEEFLVRLAEVKPQNNAKTPIAMALKQLASDLEQSSGATKVLLITDGEETCEGNASEAINDIISTKLATRIDIVSFALDNSIDRTTFQTMAKQGRGVYIDAKDGDSLMDALESYADKRIDITKNGEPIASYVAGSGEIELNAGQYTLEVDGQTLPFEIISGEHTNINLAEVFSTQTK